MFKLISLLCSFSVCTMGYLYADSRMAIAQITSDGTVDTQVTTDGNVAEITGGETRGDNLFHSFQDFSVSTNNEAFFNNANDIANIFSRVTGGKISNIDGLIRANGSANLFLVNPNGILFGENASLNIGGSFYGSTADSILFEDGEFSATDLDSPPLLTINAPIGLNFRNEPAEIVNRSTAGDVGLQVLPGETIGLIGGNIKLEGGLITAPGGLVELGGLSAAGDVSLDETGSFDFSGNFERGDLSFTNQSVVDVRADGGGFININGRNVILSQQSELLGGIADNTGSLNVRAGDITIDATESVRVLGRSELLRDFESLNREINVATAIRNNVGLSSVSSDNVSGQSDAVVNGGNIKIDTPTLELANVAVIDTSVFGVGDGGNIIINSDEVALKQSVLSSQVRGLNTEIEKPSSRNAGNVLIDTKSLLLTDASLILADVQGGVTGNGGNVVIQASDSFIQNRDSYILTQLGEGATGSAGNIEITAGLYDIGSRGVLFEGNGLPALQSGIQPGSQGDAGNITINVDGAFSIANNLVFSQIQAEATGNGGDINITAGSLDAQRGSLILADTKGIGDAGNITIDVVETVALDGDGTIVLTEVGETAQGDAGNINITANSLTVKNLADITAQTEAQGDAGDITIATNESVSLANDGEIRSLVESNATGKAGNIFITTKELNVASLSRIISDTKAQGDAGNITIIASDAVSLTDRGQIRGLVDRDAAGNGGSIAITTDGAISLTNGAEIISSVEDRATGSGGNIFLTSKELNLTNQNRIDADTVGLGNAGNITIDVTGGNINLDNSNQIQSQVRGGGEGNAGNIKITTDGSLFSVDGNLILADSQAMGDGGSITINAGEQILLAGSSKDGFPSQIVAGLSGENADGTGGTIAINTGELVLKDVAFISSNTTNGSVGEAGNITIDANSLRLMDNSFINAFTANNSDGGAITINAQTLDLVSGGKILAATDGEGNAGNINLNISEQITIDNEFESSADLVNFGSNLQLLNELQDSASGIYANATRNATGDGGSVIIGNLSEAISENITIANDAQIIVNSEGEGSGGNIFLSSQAVELNNNANISASTAFGQGGEITLQIADNIVLRNSSSISAEAFNNASGGNLNIDAGFIIAFPDGNNDIVANAEQGQGGNITINTESLLGIEERPLSDLTNDINASSTITGLDGTVDITTPDINPIQGATELPSNLVVPQQTTAQACQSNREAAAQNGLTIKGKGGVPPAPELPLDSLNVYVDGEYADSRSTTPQPVETSQGKIQPARGIKKTENGIILTAYPTNNAGDRLPETKPNCGV